MNTIYGMNDDTRISSSTTKKESKKKQNVSNTRRHAALNTPFQNTEGDSPFETAPARSEHVTAEKSCSHETEPWKST
jgi:hypothetical protein